MGRACRSGNPQAKAFSSLDMLEREHSAGPRLIRKLTLRGLRAFAIAPPHPHSHDGSFAASGSGSGISCMTAQLWHLMHDRPDVVASLAVPISIQVADARTAARDLVSKFSEGGPQRLIGAKLANPPRHLCEFSLQWEVRTWDFSIVVLYKYTYSGDYGPMKNVPATLWIAACAYRLQQQWHTVDPLELEDVARDLWRDKRLRTMPPDEAAVDWLKPINDGVDLPG